MQLQRMHCQSLKSQLCPCGSSLVSLEVFSQAQILLMVQTTAICHSNFYFSSFFISLFWNLEICSSLFLLFIPVFFSAILSILLFFSTPLSASCSVFSLSNYSLYFLIYLIVFFSDLLSFLFFSLFP